MSESPEKADANQSPAWRSYLMPGTDVLRTVAELTNPVAVALFERMVSADAETTLRQTSDRPRTFDLAHLNDVHERLFADVYPFAGQLRYVDTAKPGQTGEPFVHHRWIEAYTAAVVEQLRDQQNLTAQHDPGQWADRAAYFWAAMLHAHPYREGNGRAVRLWVEDLATAAGHPLDWTRASVERNVHVAIAAAHGDYEPMRALLTAVAGGTLGTDRPLDALNDLDKLQHGQAWARTGMVFGSAAERAALTPQLEELSRRAEAVRHHLDSNPERPASTDQPAADRWRGIAASILPGLPQTKDWPRFAAELDEGAAAGIDLAAALPRLAVRDTPAHAEPERPATRVAAAQTPEPVPTRPGLPDRIAAGYQSGLHHPTVPSRPR